MTFSTLGLSDKVQAAVAAAGYVEPTPIQAQAIPHVLKRSDIVGIAQTGTGKTASFVLPMLTLLEQGRARARMPRTLILEPTRELAAQVEENFRKYGANHRLNVALIIGGVSFDEQDRKLDRGADVLIATPGRLLDHSGRGKLLLTGVEILVIDEADRMLDMGFIPDIERICKLIPASRQTLMFSATMPPEIKRLADTFLRDPVRVEVAKPATTVATVTQRLIATGREAPEKREVLRSLIRDAAGLKNAIVFCNRKRDVAVVYRSLQRYGFNVGALHGDMDQRARTTTLDAFRAGQITLLVASDVAARGLDIPEVSHVFNYDTPVHAEDYVHRIGRTGRAGRAGTAITLVTDLDRKHLAAIEHLIGRPIDWVGEPPARGEKPEPTERRGRVRGKAGVDGTAKAADATAKGTHRAAKGAEARGRGSKKPRAADQVAKEAVQPASDSAPRQERSPDKPAPAPVRPQPAPPVRWDGERASRDQAPLRERDQRRPRDERPRDDRGSRQREPEVVGLGDHVPAFLLRPVRVREPT